ncbi:MAG: hypothetical protein ABSF58_00740 [Solirubrobacteraceae bacterium]|jgi:hypothetical protein
MSEPAVAPDPIRIVLARLARPHASGGFVVGRAAILAEGGDFAAIKDWIIGHGGTPETPAPSAGAGGLHGSRLSGGTDPSAAQVPQYVLPASALA